jgi:hypothetical protein
MKLSRTVIHVYERDQRVVRPPGLSMGVSLHSHSECSREILDFLPGVARSIPLIATLFERSMAAYQRRHGQLLDFRSVYWRPPPTPAEVIASERDQVARRFNCGAFVSLTDHDILDGPKRLRAIGRTDVPLSFEWSVPGRRDGRRTASSSPSNPIRSRRGCSRARVTC